MYDDKNTYMVVYDALKPDYYQRYTLESKMNINDDYDKEYTDMISSKLPKAGIEFMMEATFDNHKLITIMDKISSVKEDLKPGVLRALYKCLGYMVAQKIHCCKECRHLDEETL